MHSGSYNTCRVLGRRNGKLCGKSHYFTSFMILIWKRRTAPPFILVHSHSKLEIWRLWRCWWQCCCCLLVLLSVLLSAPNAQRVAGGGGTKRYDLRYTTRNNATPAELGTHIHTTNMGPHTCTVVHMCAIPATQPAQCTVAHTQIAQIK